METLIMIFAIFTFSGVAVYAFSSSFGSEMPNYYARKSENSTIPRSK
jgi:hypothetical protein